MKITLNAVTSQALLITFKSIFLPKSPNPFHIVANREFL